jgi:hypothetical protein
MMNFVSVSGGGFGDRVFGLLVTRTFLGILFLVLSPGSHCSSKALSS